MGRKTAGLLLISAALLVFISACTQDQQIPGRFDPNNVPPAITPEYSLTLENGKVVADVDYVVCIDMGEKDEFRILNFADVQISFYDFLLGNSKYRFMKETTQELADEAKPDLITLTGDQSYGLRLPLNAVCCQIDSLGIPWAPVFGNHDCEQQELSLKQQAKLYRSFVNCLFMEGPENLSMVMDNRSPAIGNYVINIVKISGDSFTVVRSLIFMNTGSHCDYDEDAGIERYSTYTFANLNENQVRWFKAMASSVQKYSSSPVPSTLIFHMPVFGFVRAAEAAFRNDADIYDIPEWLETTKNISFADSGNTDNWNEGYKDSFGVMHEDCGCPPYDDGIFDAIKETGTIDMVVAGHDHINNFSIRYQGVNLIYALKTGVASYNEDGMTGGTLITVSSDGSAAVRHILNTP